MKRTTRYSWIISAGAIALGAGCAHPPIAQTTASPAVEPLYRFSEPVGTAAGQYAVGRLDLAEGRVDAAILRFRAALRLDAKFLDAYNGLGVAYGQQGRFDEAIEQFSRALQVSPAAAHVLNNLGYARLKAGQVAQAQAVLERAVAQDPESVGARANLAVAAAALRQGGGADLATDELLRDGGLPGPVFAQIDLDPSTIAFTQTAEPPPISVRTFAASGPGGQASDSGYRVITAAESTGEVVRVSQNIFEWRDRKPHSLAAAISVNPSQTKVNQQQAPTAETPVASVNAEAKTASTLLAAIRQFLPEKLSRAFAQKVSVDYGAIEIVNNLDDRSLGQRWSDQLRKKGLEVVRVTDQQSPVQDHTTILHRSGFSVDARHLADRLRMIGPRVEVSNALPVNVDIRLILGRDASRPLVVDASEPTSDSQARARILIDGFVI